MKSSDRILGWLVGILLLASAFWALTLSFLGAFFFTLAAAFMIPPVREKVYSLNKHQLQGQTRAYLVTALCFIALMPILIGSKKDDADKVSMVQQEADRKAAEQQKQNLALSSQKPSATHNYTYPIEKDAEIYKDVSQRQVLLLREVIELAHYSCSTVSAVTPLSIFDKYPGYSVTCNNWKYVYNVEDRGGRMTVELK